MNDEILAWKESADVNKKNEIKKSSLKTVIAKEKSETDDLFKKMTNVSEKNDENLELKKFEVS